MSSVTYSNQGTILDAVSWSFFVFALIILCMRLYAHILVLRSPPRTDTYIACFTFLAAITSQVFTTLSVHHGMGQHQESLNRLQIMYSLKWSWMAQIFQLLANTTGKVAVMTYIIRLHGPSHAKASLAYLSILGFLQVTSVIVLIAFILAQCSPLQKLWNEAIPGTCNGRIRNQNFAFFQGSLSAFTDIGLVVYPVVVFWNLQMKLAKKVLLCVLFGFGLLAAGSSIVKTSNLHRIGVTTDTTYDLAYLITWNASDMYIVFIAGSIPTLSPIFKKTLPKSTKPNPCDNDRRNTRFNGDDGIVLTSSIVAPGRTATYAGRKAASQIDDYDSSEESWIMNRHVVTPKNDVERNEGFEGTAW